MFKRETSTATERVLRDQTDQTPTTVCLIFMSPLSNDCYFLMAKGAYVGGAMPYAVFRSTDALQQFLNFKTELNRELVAEIAECAASGENFGRVISLPSRVVTGIMQNLVQVSLGRRR